ncbi:hypothetical protein [Frankia sp. CiP3]|uniref:hypothetical protein n=1 Tax=Frankia sp. CiP3 TaxID=2880971 RepID=UPI001EF5A688|nr:hypothetical protein [Frankia sp. CiP3]
MTGRVAVAAGALLVVVAILCGAAAGVFTGAAGLTASGMDGTGAVGGPPDGTAARDIPAGYQQLYVAAAATCPGLPWPVLAAVGKVAPLTGLPAETPWRCWAGSFLIGRSHAADRGEAA